MGTKYIHRITWDERSDILGLIKYVKTYDYIYLSPVENYINIYAIQASSVFCNYMIPGSLPGEICVQTTPFVTMTNNSIAKYIKDKLNKTFKMPDPDIEFPTLQEMISKYVYLYQLKEQFIIKDKDHIVYAMAYHMIPYLSRVQSTIYGYKSLCLNGQGYVKKLNEEDTQSMINEIKSMRADDGTKLYALSKAHIITIYAGMVPLNKADSLEVMLYDIPTDNKFLVEYIVHKSKAEPIYIYSFLLRI